MWSSFWSLALQWLVPVAGSQAPGPQGTPGPPSGSRWGPRCCYPRPPGPRCQMAGDHQMPWPGHFAGDWRDFVSAPAPVSEVTRVSALATSLRHKQSFIESELPSDCDTYVYNYTYVNKLLACANMWRISNIYCDQRVVVHLLGRLNFQFSIYQFSWL